MSPYGPDARFTVGGAKGRNRLIHCMAELAVVVSAAEGEGETWVGATEALKHGWVPLAVRSGEAVPAGSRALLARGAMEFSFKSAPAAVPTSVVAEPATSTEAPDAAFEVAWPDLARLLSGPKPKTVKALAAALGVPEARVRSWLETAEAAGRVRRRGQIRSWELIEPTLF